MAAVQWPGCDSTCLARHSPHANAAWSTCTLMFSATTMYCAGRSHRRHRMSGLLMLLLVRGGVGLAPTNTATAAVLLAGVPALPFTDSYVLNYRPRKVSSTGWVVTPCSILSYISRRKVPPLPPRTFDGAPPPWCDVGHLTLGAGRMSSALAHSIGAADRDAHHLQFVH